MRHGIDYRKLGRTSSHYVATMRNLALALFEHERIVTTTPKAKELRRFAERLITFGKRGGLHRRRLAYSVLGNKMVVWKKNSPEPEVFDPVKKIFADLADRYKNRQGGYTRIVHCGNRPGDNAPISIIELVDYKPKAKKKKAEGKKTKEAEEKEEGKEASDKKKQKKAKKAETKKAEKEEKESERKPKK